MRVNQFVASFILAVILVPSVAGATWYPFKAMTYNIHSGRNEAGQYQLPVTADVIRNSGADVVALQEVSRWWDAPCHDTFQELIIELSNVYPYYSFAAADSQPANLFFCGWNHARSVGVAIFSKYPLQSTWSFQLPTTWSKRVALAVTTYKNNVPFTVYSTHLQNDSPGVVRSSDRRAQAQAVANDAQPRLANSNVFVMGDFNAGAGSWELAPLGAIMVPPSNSWGIDLGYTFPWSSTMTANCAIMSSDHCSIVIDWWYWR